MSTFQITHRSVYRYPQPVYANRNLLRLTPATVGDQRLLDFRLEVKPEAYVARFTDHFGNNTHMIHVGSRHEVLEITTSSQVEKLAGLSAHAPPPVRMRLREVTAALGEELAEFLEPSYYCPQSREVEGWCREAGAGPDAPALESLEALMGRIFGGFRYLPGTTTVSTRAPEVITRREGVCQDFAHLMISAARCWGIPCRYVSGYLEGEGFSHAWAEAWLPGSGWMAFDPTHNCRPDGSGYVKVAVGRDYADVSPVYGFYRGAQKGMLEVSVKVVPEPREAG